VALELLLIADMTRTTTGNPTAIKNRIDDPSRHLMIDLLIEELVRKRLREAHSPRAATLTGGRSTRGESYTRGVSA
jgi:hypothetical protein